MSLSTDRIERARLESERARKRLASTMGALQRRLRPATLMTNAWEGVREKGEALAEDAVQAVKDRPLAFSGIGAAILLFLAREPVRRFVASLLPAKDEGPEAENDMITAHLAEVDEHYDLTAPTVKRTRHKGATI
jgi:hypothetical protein